jgi:capsular exopolysaccharide synthesis family protein
MQISSSINLSDPNNNLTNVRVVQRAKPATVPYKPNTKKNLTLSLLLGFLFGLGLTFLLDFLDNTVDTSRDLEELIRLPVLASIPKVVLSERSILPVSRKKVGNKTAETKVGLIAHHDAKSPAAEAYRDLRTAILLSGAGKPPRTITVTSAVPGEGKSSTILNLGIVFAQLGKRVVVVDSDLRRPRLHLSLEQPNDAGASTYLSGMSTRIEELIQPTMVNHLDFLPSGPQPPNPSELLNGPVFGKMLVALKEAGYDHILLDAPPVLAVADPMILASIVDCTLVVIRSGSTQKQAIRHCIDKFRKSDIRVIGAILNDTEVRRAEYRQYTHKYYKEQSRSSGGA